MAFLVKNRPAAPSVGTANSGMSVLDQWIHVSTPTRSLPQTTTDVIFKVRGGRVLVKLLLGEVTTVFQGTDPVLKVSSQKLDAAMAATVGTAVDIASTADTSSLEVGGLIIVEGDLTAILIPNAGAGALVGNQGEWIAPRGQIYLTTGASKTGASKWDIWYIPLDEGAYVEGQATAAVKV